VGLGVGLGVESSKIKYMIKLIINMNPNETAAVFPGLFLILFINSLASKPPRCILLRFVLLLIQIKYIIKKNIDILVYILL